MIAQSDDPGLLEWLSNAYTLGGTFLSSLARAALIADGEDYPLIRPLVEVMRLKYPQYESEAAKQEIRNRKESA